MGIMGEGRRKGVQKGGEWRKIYCSIKTKKTEMKKLKIKNKVSLFSFKALDINVNNKIIYIYGECHFISM